VTAQPSDPRAARAMLTYLTEPADPILGALLQIFDPRHILAAIRSGALPADVTARLDELEAAKVQPALARWRARLATVPAGAGLARHAADGLHLLCPRRPRVAIPAR
jgi:hypothetical protein